MRRRAGGEAQANTEAEAKVQAGLEATDRAAEEARAASAIKRGYIRRFIAEGLVAATPPESTTANDKTSRDPRVVPSVDSLSKFWAKTR
jgi:hypothetical protein